MNHALDGVTVLEVGVMTPGKFCGFLMGGWGAESIRVERPGRDGELSTEDLLLNRGKRSIALNLRDERGRDLLLRLCGNADVLIECYRPGVAARLGIDYESVCAVNDGIVYCSLSGFGQDGPDKALPAYDLLFQARSGLTHLMGTETPVSPRTWLADAVSGLMAASAISAALRQKAITGSGSHIDLAMLDSVFALLAVSHGTMGARTAGVEVEARARRPAYDIYEAGDGRYVALAAARDASCNALFAELARPDLAQSGMRPGAEGQAAATFLRETFRKKPAAAWVETLSALDIEISRVNSPEEAYDDPQLLARGMVRETSHPAVGALRQIGIPCGEITAGAPAIGQDTAAVLRELGCDDAAVSELRSDGVI